MTAEQQLERSVLESKERDELHAIAQALSVKTNTRTKKADIIDGILKATGVAVGGGTADSANGGGNGATTNGDAPGGSGGGAPGARPNGPSTSRQKPVVRSFGPADDVERSDGPSDLDDDFGDVKATADADDGSGQGESGGQSGAQQTGAGTRQGGGGSQQSGDGGRQSNQPGGNGQGSNQGNRNNRNNLGNQNSQGNHNNQNPQGGGNDDAGNRRTNRRRRGRDRQGGDGDLQGSGTQEQQYQGELIPVSGLLDLRDEGYGFLRC